MSSDPIPFDRKRRRDAEALRALLPDLPQNVPDLDDDAGWEEHDARIRDQISAQSHRLATQTAEKRAAFLVSKGWPRVPVEDALRLEDDAGRMLRRIAHLAGVGGLPPGRAGRPCRMLVLSSGVGSGKTTAACRWQLHRDDSRPVFLRAAAIAACSRYDEKFRRRWEDSSSLVIDDLGREYADGKGSLLSDLEEIVDHCYSNAIPLVMTTNAKPDTFWERYGGKEGPIASRLRGVGAWFSSNEPDRRKP
jgi:hypothetical protein